MYKTTNCRGRNGSANSFKSIVMPLMLFVGSGGYAQRPDGETQITIVTSGGSYPSEKWVSITTEPDGEGTQVWTQGNGTYGNGSGLINTEICLAPGTYYVNCYDVYADGWDGTTISISAYGIVLNNNGELSPNDGTDTDNDYQWEPVEGNPNPAELEASLEIIVPEAPDCMPPSGLTATALSLTSMELSWTSDGDSFEVEWGEAGFEQGDGTIEAVTDTSLEVTTVTDTPYEFYVRQDCGDDGYSMWAGPFSFVTGYCAPLYLYGCSSGAKISNVTTSDAILNIAN